MRVREVWKSWDQPDVLSFYELMWVCRSSMPKKYSICLMSWGKSKSILSQSQKNSKFSTFSSQIRISLTQFQSYCFNLTWRQRTKSKCLMLSCFRVWNFAQGSACSSRRTSASRVIKVQGGRTWLDNWKSGCPPLGIIGTPTRARV